MPNCHSIILNDAKTIVYVTNDSRFSVSRLNMWNQNFTNLGAGMKEIYEIRVTKQTRNKLDFTLKFLPETWKPGEDPEEMTTDFSYTGSYIIEW